LSSWAEFRKYIGEVIRDGCERNLEHLKQATRNNLAGKHMEFRKRVGTLALMEPTEKEEISFNKARERLESYLKNDLKMKSICDSLVECVKNSSDLSNLVDCAYATTEELPGIPVGLVGLATDTVIRGNMRPEDNPINRLDRDNRKIAQSVDF
jgi:hypothetical protein